jgi:predicted TIM-barrel fold metal-dependent hydrolase
MIVDADCHISSRRFDALALTADDLVARMDDAQVDKALVWLKPPYDKNIEPENHAVYEGARKYPSRLIPFGWVNPRLGQDKAYETVSRCFDEYGFHGIKLNGAQDDYVIDDEKLVMPIIERIAGYGKVIAFHIGADFPENTHPFRLGNIARRFPETTFILIHIGGAAFPSLDRAAIEIAKQHPNIYTIGSAIHERAILSAIDVLGAERVCFGSDMPFFLMHVRKAMYQALLKNHTAEERGKIMGGNILRLLNLPAS